MGNLRTSLAIAVLALVVPGLAACGSNTAKTPDAAPPKPDAAPMPDAPPPTPDAPPPPTPDAAPAYDFSCYGATAPTTADDPVTVSGTTETFSTNGLAPVGAAGIVTYKSGSAAPLDTTTSDATTGAFTTGNLPTGGAPLDGYLEVTKASYRTTYLYPPNPVAKSVAMIPVPMLSTSTFGTATTLLGVTQDDTNDGALLVEVADCSLTPISGATLSVQQAGASVGQAYDLGSFLSQAAGIYIVFNVPDGATDISATYNGMTFPAHTVVAYKAPTGAAAVGTITSSALVPGP